MSMGRKILFVGGGLAALWGGSKLYNRWKNGAPSHPAAPTSTNGGSTSASDAGAGTITGPNPGDTNGLVSTGYNADTGSDAGGGDPTGLALGDTVTSAGDSTYVPPSDPSSLDNSSATADAGSVLDSFSGDLGIATDAASILGM